MLCILFCNIFIAKSFLFLLSFHMLKKCTSLKCSKHDARPIFKYAKIAVFVIYSMLAEKLNMTPEEAERWIVNLIRNARLDAKIDSKLVSYLFVWYIASSCKGLTVAYHKINSLKLLILRSESFASVQKASYFLLCQERQRKVVGAKRGKGPKIVRRIKGHFVLAMESHLPCFSSIFTSFASCQIRYVAVRYLHTFVRLTVVSIQINSFEVYIVSRTWLKERRIFIQNDFLVQLQTLLKVIEIFGQFHCLSSYRNVLYRNDRFPLHTRLAALWRQSPKLSLSERQA